MTTQKTQRVQKLLSAAGFCSRRKAEELIKEGRVTVNGTAISIGDKASPTDLIAVDGQDISTPRKLYYLFNKPAGYVTALSDPEHETIMQFIKTPERVFPVGRLDKDTTGFLILTNDGDFANKVMHPRNEVQKTYRVTLVSPISAEQVDLLRSGIELRDGKTAPAKITPIDRKYLEVTIHEGKNQIIKRMFKRLGFRVKSLERVATGRLSLGKLRPGELRELSLQELEKVFVRIAVPAPAKVEASTKEKLLTKKTASAPRRRSTRFEHRAEAVSTRSLQRASREESSSFRERKDPKDSRFSRNRDTDSPKRFERSERRPMRSRDSSKSTRFSRDRDTDSSKRFERSERRPMKSRDSSKSTRFSREGKTEGPKRFSRTDSSETRLGDVRSRSPQRENSRVRENRDSTRFSPRQREGRDNQRSREGRFSPRDRPQRFAQRDQSSRYSRSERSSERSDQSRFTRSRSEKGESEEGKRFSRPRQERSERSSESRFSITPRQDKSPERFDPNVNYKARRKAGERSGRKGGFRKGSSSRSRDSSRSKRRDSRNS